ncbi:MAG TPA: lysylphosphatidylglycerol synthase domain-containing protein [Gemmatimonadaceae bacterium]|nr:lysylphosphatidylglycerol synthase domain-containing protein [Gemmatimonadaceae bacterium]
MPERPLRRKLLRAAQAILLAAVIVFAGSKLVDEWGQVQNVALGLTPRWSYVLASCLIVFATYAVLIEVWRVLLTGWEARLRFGEAARIWTISNLGRYVPGKVWQIGAMAVMAKQRGVSGIAAGGSAIVATIITTLTGFAVVAIAGARTLRIPPLAVGLILIAGLALLAAPIALPWLGPIISRVARRPVTVPRLPLSALLITVFGSALAWCGYGVAFYVLAHGLLGDIPGSVPLYIAVFTGSYLIGFLTLIAPGGLFVREVAMQTALQSAGFSAGSATVLVVASRLWLTVLEILPAVLFLLAQPVRWRSPDVSSTKPSDDRT